MAPTTDRPILKASATGYYTLRSSQWFPHRGLGRITLTDAGIRWIQRWPRFWSKWHPFIRWAPPCLVIPIEEIRSVGFAGNWGAHIEIRTDDGAYLFLIGRALLPWSWRREGRGWLAAIERLMAARDRANSKNNNPPDTP